MHWLTLLYLIRVIEQITNISLMLVYRPNPSPGGLGCRKEIMFDQA